MDVDGADSKLTEQQSLLDDKKAAMGSMPGQSENVKGETKLLEQGQTDRGSEGVKNFVGAPSCW